MKILILSQEERLPNNFTIYHLIARKFERGKYLLYGDIELPPSKTVTTDELFRMIKELTYDTSTT